jgi:hypothetical protein
MNLTYVFFHPYYCNSTGYIGSGLRRESGVIIKIYTVSAKKNGRSLAVHCS